MIPKRAIKSFLARPRGDFRAYKKLKPDELERMVGELPVKPPIWDRLMLHQKICFIIGAREQRFGFWLDLGMGKTYLATALARYFRKAGIAREHLFLVPNKVNKFEIAQDIRKLSPTTGVCVLHGSSAQKWQQLEASRDTIVIETYAGLVRMVCAHVDVKRKGKKRRKLQPVPALLKRLSGRFTGLIMDESTTVQRKGALAFRVCRQLSKRAATVFELTGTPFGRDPKMLWGQFYLLDFGKTLGENLGLFRAAFFTESNNGFGIEYTFRKRMKQTLFDFAAARSIRFKANEGDLPKLTMQVKEVQLPADARTYYDAAKKAIIAAHGNYQEMKNAFIRMRQISSGFLGYKDDETGERAQYVFPRNPKLDMLMAQVETVCEGGKLVVFHEFIKSGDLICAALEKAGVGHVRLYGKTKDHEAVLSRFHGDDAVRVIVLNNAAGSFGLDRLKVAQYGTYYEAPVSVIIRKQTLRRVQRQLSPHERVFITDLVVRGTVDQQILAYHEQGRDLFDAIVDGSLKL